MCTADSTIEKCQYHGCIGELGIDYEKGGLKEIMENIMSNEPIIVCPDCYQVIMDENHDSDFSDIHPDQTVDDFHDSFDLLINNFQLTK